VRVGSDSAIGPRSHVVQFYGREEELTRGVGEYLAEAINGGSVALVVATPAHRQAFEQWLAASGVDAAAARRAGTYLTVDADDAVRRFVVGGQVDAARFDQVIGRLVRDAVASGRPVRAYGEMVAILWDAGQINAALELETQWNELSRELPFSLYCAYPEESVAGHAHRESLQQVHRLHEAVINSGPQTEPLPGRPAGRAEVWRAFLAHRGAPRLARHFATDTLRRWGADEVVGDAALVVTELATNAVVHAESAFTVAMAMLDGGIRVSVSDTVPMPEGESLPADPGHGLGVISAMSTAWGIRPTAEGKIIWAELRP
jgi:MEDS: MEthanogen/methylotroph, DcmR Sensory domain